MFHLQKFPTNHSEDVELIISSFKYVNLTEMHESAQRFGSCNLSNDGVKDGATTRKVVVKVEKLLC